MGLTELVSKRIGQTALDIRNYASRLQAEKKFIHSLLFHQVSIKFRDESDPIWGWISLETSRIVECVQKSLMGIYTAMMNMPERVVLYQQIIDIVKEIQSDLAKNEDMGPKTQAVAQAWCWLTLGSMQLHCKKDLKGSKESYDEGINVLSWTMDDADKYWIYGALCLGMADVYKSTNEEYLAKEYYQKGATALKSAQDFSDEDEKNSSVKMAEKYVS